MNCLQNWLVISPREDYFDGTTGTGRAGGTICATWLTPSLLLLLLPNDMHVAAEEKEAIDDLDVRLISVG